VLDVLTVCATAKPGFPIASDDVFAALGLARSSCARPSCFRPSAREPTPAMSRAACSSRRSHHLRQPERGGQVRPARGPGREEAAAAPALVVHQQTNPPVSPGRVAPSARARGPCARARANCRPASAAARRAPPPLRARPGPPRRRTPARTPRRSRGPPPAAPGRRRRPFAEGAPPRARARPAFFRHGVGRARQGHRLRPEGVVLVVVGRSGITEGL